MTPAVGTLVVATVATGTDLDTNGYFLRIGAVRASSTVRIGPNDTLAISGLPPGTVALDLYDVSLNCWLNGESQRRAGIPAGGVATVTWVVVCEPWPKEPNAEALVGVWEATRWEFFADSGLGSLLEDVMANGMAGTLTVTRTGAAEILWQWRETYRWWGPDRPTVIHGHAMVGTDFLISVVDSATSEFDCDWGDCDGPLHGEHNFFVWTEDGLVITRPQPVVLAYRPNLAWTRLTLARAP